MTGGASHKLGECCTLTQAEKGMMNAFAAFCRVAGLLTHAEDMLRYSIVNWGKYVQVLHTENGVYKPAIVLAPGLLARYPRAAVNLWLRANGSELRNGVLLSIPPKSKKPPVEAPVSQSPKRLRYAEWDEGTPDPSPRDVAELRHDPDVAATLAEGGVFILVPLLIESGRSVKANISLDRGLLEAIDEAAKRVGVTRSSFLASAARKKIAEMA